MDINILQDKFNQRINYDGPMHPILQTQCWLWTGDKTFLGYGVINYTENNKRTRMYAHRFSLLQKDGHLDKYALHHCDTPSCVNPDHLFQGTAKDNALDMCKKGRWNAGPPRGHRNPSAKLTESQVLQIRHQHKNGQSGRSLGREYGVTKGTIQNIVQRTTWTHI